MKKRANPIRAYHESFRGDTYDACQRCGGRCEQHKTSTLVPGEASYLAAHLGISLSELRRGFLDRIDTPYGSVDVIRLRYGCPFLDSEKRCTVLEAKPILCDCYPIIVMPSRGRPSFGVDRRDCPMTRWPRYRSCIEKFVANGIPALERLHLPPSWRTTVALYDEFDFDHERIERELKRSPGHEVVMLEELLVYACNGYERKARERGMRLLAIRIRGALASEVAAIRACGQPGGHRMRGESASAISSLRLTGREMLRRIEASRRDRALLSESDGRRYRRLVLDAKAALHQIRNEAKTSVRRLKRASRKRRGQGKARNSAA